MSAPRNPPSFGITDPGWGSRSDSSYTALPYLRHGPPVNFTEPPPDPVGYARAADGSLVPVGVPVSHTAAARLWRWPTQFLPDAWAFAAPLLTVAVHAGVAWLIYRVVSRHLK